MGAAGTLTLIRQDVVRDHLAAALIHSEQPLRRSPEECNEPDSDSEEAEI